MKDKIIYDDVIMKGYFSKNFKSLLDGLLTKNPKFRLNVN